MKKFAKFVLFVSSIGIVGSLAIALTCKIKFDQNCKGYLKRAANASTIELAEKELGTALKFLESQSLTSGSTHTFYFTPACEIDFWYQNLKAAQQDLQTFPTDADLLTRSNQLMKLREAIVDSDEDGPEVVVPPGLELLPWHHAVRWSVVASLVGGLVSFLMLATGENSGCCQSRPVELNGPEKE
jgi:hypothetical protein